MYLLEIVVDNKIRKKHFFHETLDSVIKNVVACYGNEAHNIEKELTDLLKVINNNDNTDKPTICLTREININNITYELKLTKKNKPQNTNIEDNLSNLPIELQKELKKKAETSFRLYSLWGG